MKRQCPIISRSKTLLASDNNAKVQSLIHRRSNVGAGKNTEIVNTPSIWGKLMGINSCDLTPSAIKSKVTAELDVIQNLSNKQRFSTRAVQTTTSQQYGRVLPNENKLQGFLQPMRQYSQKTTRTLPNVVEDNQTNVIQIPSQSLRNVPQPFEHSPDIGQMFTASQLRVQLAAPSQLQVKPDADNLLFGKTFTDHMLKVYWHKSLGGWQAPEITPIENLVLHPAAKVLHYAFELFEGMKAYRGVDGRIRIFRPKMNMNRMNLSAQRSGLPSFLGDELIACLSRLISIDQEWVPHTDAASLYIRPTLIGIDPKLGIRPLESALLYVILSPVGSYFKTTTSKGEGGLSLLADPRYTRAWPGGVGDRKMGSNYAPTVHVQNEAEQKGLQQVLWLYGEDHQLTEVGTMNVFMYFINDNGEKELRTPPLNGLILPGITRDSVLSLARQWGRFKVTENDITMPYVKQLVKENRILEVFGTGTACVVSPIKRIHYLDEDILIPTMEQENAVFNNILTELTNIQYGKTKNHLWAVTID